MQEDRAQKTSPCTCCKSKYTPRLQELAAYPPTTPTRHKMSSITESLFSSLSAELAHVVLSQYFHSSSKAHRASGHKTCPAPKKQRVPFLSQCFFLDLYCCPQLYAPPSPPLLELLTATLHPIHIPDALEFFSTLQTSPTRPCKVSHGSVATGQCLSVPQ